MSTPMNRLYVQTLDQPLPPQDTRDKGVFARKIERLHALLSGADAVVIGAGSGMSTASGYDFYHESELFDAAFGAFRKAHGFATLFDGMYHLFPDNEQQWAFNAAVADFADALPLGEPYRRLAKIVEDMEHFVLTTNVDGQVPRAFDEGRYWLFQGDLRFMQCSQPCDDAVVHDCGLTVRLLSETVQGADDSPRVPSDLLPRCPHCHRLMAPWVRDTAFLEGSLWRAQKSAYEAFLTRHLMEGEGNVLFLELGVSSMTPSIIKMPFWDMVARNPRASYVEVNCAEETTPLQLGDRAMVITADIARVMEELER
jgi:NAD-dependent SIR2 family protein deacetylase